MSAQSERLTLERVEELERDGWGPVTFEEWDALLEIAKRALSPDETRRGAAINEARVCLKCGRTESGWRYNRCPHCGEMADGAVAQAAPAPMTPQELRKIAATLPRSYDAQLLYKHADWMEAR